MAVMRMSHTNDIFKNDCHERLSLCRKICYEGFKFANGNNELTTTQI